MIYCICTHYLEQHDSAPAADGEHLEFLDCLADGCECQMFELKDTPK